MQRPERSEEVLLGCAPSENEYLLPPCTNNVLRDACFMPFLKVGR